MKRAACMARICSVLLLAAAFCNGGVGYAASGAVPTIQPVTEMPKVGLGSALNGDVTGPDLSGVSEPESGPALQTVAPAQEPDSAIKPVVKEEEYDVLADIISHFDAAAPLELGGEIRSEGIANIVFDKAYWAEELLPHNTEGPYSYISGGEGYYFLVLEGRIENLQEDKIALNTFQIGDITPYVAVVSYGGNYYLAKLAAATKEDDSVVPEVAGGEEVSFYLYATVPEEDHKPGVSISALLGFSDLQETIFSAVGKTSIDWDSCGDCLYKIDAVVEEKAPD